MIWPFRPRHHHTWRCTETHTVVVTRGGHDDRGRWFGAGQTVTQAVYRCGGDTGCGDITQQIVPGTWTAAQLNGDDA